jgi:uncharacterized protein (TIGR02270 family)
MTLVQSPHANLDRLDRFDRRLAANFDGLRLSGSEGWAVCEAALETPSPGVVFTVTARTIEERDEARLTNILAMTEAQPETRGGMLDAFEWSDPTNLRGLVAKLLRERDGYKRMVGVAACAAHRVDPGIASDNLLRSPDPSVRAQSLKAAGELGLVDARPVCLAAITDADEDTEFWACRSAVLLGDRSHALGRLKQHGLSAMPRSAEAFRLTLQALTIADTHRILQDLAGDPERTRFLIEGSGIAGDARYVPWLVKQMADVRTARLAGESFSTITGVHLGHAALDRPAPERLESSPTDDPDDMNVEIDADDGLSWPDAAKIGKWWENNGDRFETGTRYFMGKPITSEHCVEILKTGYQRQRILAAQYLCLLDPGTPLFNTSAPAWRQQRLLAKM